MIINSSKHNAVIVFTIFRTQELSAATNLALFASCLRAQAHGCCLSRTGANGY